MAAKPKSLRDRQIGMAHSLKGVSISDMMAASIEKILGLNKELSDSTVSVTDTSTNGLIPQSTAILNENGEPIWKVLVFDNMGRDIISSVMRVNDLRARGVTIHLLVRTSNQHQQGIMDGSLQAWWTDLRSGT